MRAWPGEPYPLGATWTGLGVNFTPLGPSESSTPTLLDGFTIEKAFDNLSYELTSRPEWVLIPLIGIRTFIDG